MRRWLPLLLLLVLVPPPARAGDGELLAGFQTTDDGIWRLVVTDGTKRVVIGVDRFGRPAGGRTAADIELAPATLRFGRTSLRGLVRNRYGFGHPVDEALYVLEVRAADGGRMGLLAMCAARPDPLPEGMMFLSGSPQDQVVEGGEAFERRVEAALARAEPLEPRIARVDSPYEVEFGNLTIGFVRASLMPGLAVRERSSVEGSKGGYYYCVSASREPLLKPPMPAVPAPPVDPRVEPLAPASRFTPFRVDRVWVDSPRPSGNAGNDRFPVEHYVPDGEAKAAIVILPIWKGGVLLAERVVAGHLAARGYECAIVPLPWQFQRAPEGVRGGDWTVSSDLERTRAALRQARADVGMVASWLRGPGPTHRRRLGILGISLGAFVAAAEYQTDPRYEAGVFVMAGGDPATLVWNASRETRRMKAELEAKGVTLPELREFLAPLDPAEQRPYPEFPAFPRYRGVLMVNGTEDTVVPPENADVLWRALGKPKIRWFPVNHYSMATKIPEVLRLTDEHLDAVFR